MATANKGKAKTKAKVTKNEAVRLALAHLGKEAGRVQIRDFVKARFHIVMSLDHVSTARAEALRKMAERETAPEPEPRETLPVPVEAIPEPAPTPAIAKNEAVRQAVLELGSEATVAQIQDFVKERFGLEMTAGHVSTERSMALGKKAAKKKPAAKKPAAKKPAAKKPAVGKVALVETATAHQPLPVEPSPAGNGAIRLEDILLLRDLVDRVGADHLRTLIGVLAGR